MVALKPLSSEEIQSALRPLEAEEAEAAKGKDASAKSGTAKITLEMGLS